MNQIASLSPASVVEVEKHILNKNTVKSICGYFGDLAATTAPAPPPPVMGGVAPAPPPPSGSGSRVGLLDQKSESLEVLSPKSKVDVVSEACSNVLSPSTTQNLFEKIDGGHTVVDFIKTIAKKRDKASNCARSLAYNHLVQKAGRHMVRRQNRGLKFQSLSMIFHVFP